MKFVRYRAANDYVEQFFFCGQLSKNTTGKEILKKVDSFFQEHRLSWANCVSACADGVPSMMEIRKGFMSFVNKENNDILIVHCYLRRENLAAREIQENLTVVFKEVVSVVNYIKSRPLCTRLFRVFCDKLGTEPGGLLYHSNIPWLSRGKVLERVANLRNKVGAFFKEQKHELSERFSDNEWIAKLLFLADFFSHLNQLNTSMQGKDKIFLDVSEDIIAFKARMESYMHRMEHGKIAAFPALNAFVEEEFNLHNICQIFLVHLSSFLFKLDMYILSHDYSRTFNWVRCHFELSALQVHSETDCIAKQLIELQSRQLWRNKFKNVSLTQFWAEVQSKEPNLSDLSWQATKALLPFSTTYLCEAVFSALAMIKTKYRNQLQPEDDIGCALTTIDPNFDNLVMHIQG